MCRLEYPHSGEDVKRCSSETNKYCCSNQDGACCNDESQQFEYGYPSITATVSLHIPSSTAASTTPTKPPTVPTSPGKTNGSAAGALESPISSAAPAAGKKNNNATKIGVGVGVAVAVVLVIVVAVGVWLVKQRDALKTKKLYEKSAPAEMSADPAPFVGGQEFRYEEQSYIPTQVGSRPTELP